MQIIPYGKFIVDNIDISNVIYDEHKNLYFSEIKYNLGDNIFDLANIGFETDNMKLLKISNTSIHVEFLHTSNKFYNFIKNIDDHIVHNVIKNSKKYFGIDFQHNTFSSIYSKSIKLPDKIPALPKLILELCTDCSIFNRHNRISIDDLKEGQEIQMIINIDKIYFDKCSAWLKYSVKRICIINNLCPTLDCLFDEIDNYELDSEDEIDYAATINDF